MKKHIFLFLLGVILLNSCAILRPPTVSKYGSLYDYQYVYIISTSEKSSTYGLATGGVYTGYNGGVYGSAMGQTLSRSVNPAELVGGHFIKHGFVRLPELNPNLLDKTLIVSCCESGRRQVGFGFTLEVTVQIFDAKNHHLLCIGSAEGQGSTEVDDIRIAINRCMEAIFQE